MHYIMSDTPSKAECHHAETIGWGKDRAGNARRKCKTCGMVVSIVPPRPLGRMRISLDDATLVLSLLTEGSSIRSAERVSGIHRDTICKLLRVAGEKCEAPVSSGAQRRG
jgi:transposase-like protein